MIFLPDFVNKEQEVFSPVMHWGTKNTPILCSQSVVKTMLMYFRSECLYI